MLRVMSKPPTHANYLPVFPVINQPKNHCEDGAVSYVIWQPLMIFFVENHTIPNKLVKSSLGTLSCMRDTRNLT